MALSFKDPETDALARQVADLTGESLTQAVKVSLSERLTREQGKRFPCSDRRATLEQIIKEYQALPILDHRSADEIIGYNERGLFD